MHNKKYTMSEMLFFSQHLETWKTLRLCPANLTYSELVVD